ncbi:uncharacterized protein MELLADRAFT_107605 [Melampsora larici-populina 98AG31]|uniref:Uncharacterized protein n=1 Tax=Melampsora larici-populina (strain 98AG31 / pathotype 3-4-7) TaxID=747676 RepID=F4RQ67_MELLP|nr:uncharacterized protein MELLADRAFT_107605 [Melampsora larici-populina 98AG31]EGG05459.1 hypothetical protein MELLADRAFT_107605 [Melampsora larici-populina 98AG31]
MTATEKSLYPTIFMIVYNHGKLKPWWPWIPLLVLFLKFLSLGLCTGLQLETGILGSPKCPSEDTSWMEVDYPPDYNPPEDFYSDSCYLAQVPGSKGSVHMHTSIENSQIENVLREETPVEEESGLEQIPASDQSKSRKKKKQIQKVVENSDRNIFKTIDMGVPLPRKLNLQEVTNKVPRPRVHSQSYWKVRKSPSANNKFFLFQKVGIHNANLSPTLCYLIFESFHEIYKALEFKCGHKHEAIKAATQAVKNASYGVVMVFLGLIRVFEAEGSRKDNLEVLLNDGWDYLENFFQTWKNAELGDFSLQEDIKFESQYALEPYFHLRYLKRINHPNKVPFLLAYLLALYWSQNRKTTGIPRHGISQHIQRLVDVCKADSNSFQGGLYGRIDIRNHAFWGAEQFSRKYWYSYGDTAKSPQDVLFLSSNAAQFHTPIGREMCRAVHIFFEDLIRDLNQIYLAMNGHPHLKDIAPEVVHEMGIIAKAVSMAEYRVTVVVLGMIRVLNKQHFTDSQLERLIMNAWNFLKKKFSEWRLLNFHTKDSQNIFNYDSAQFECGTQADNPEALFHGLVGYKSKNKFPKQCITYLFNSWMKSVTQSKPGSEEYMETQTAIQGIPLGSIEQWNLSLRSHNHMYQSPGTISLQ